MSAVAEHDAGKPVWWRSWIPSAVVGLIGGLDNVASGVAVGALLFTGPLAAGLGLGVAIVLFGAGLLALTVALKRGPANGVALVQETSVAILAGAVAAMAARLDGPVEAGIVTAIAMLGSASLITGVLFWVSGRLRLGAFARFLPYPVVAGFLAGTGWLLVDGASAMLTGGGAAALLGEGLRAPATLVPVLPAIAFAAIMLLAMRRFPHPATAPAAMIGAVLTFYAVIAGVGLDLDEVRGLGLLPVEPDGGVTAFAALEFIGLIEWGEVLRAAPSMLSAAALAMIALLLNVSGLELATGRDIDANAELRTNGAANLLSGACGGPIGYVDLPLSLLADRVGASGRRAGLVTATAMFAALAMAGPLIAHIPTFLTAGFILYMGTGLLIDWLGGTRRLLPPAEWLIVVAILAAIVLVGFLEGVAVGLIVSVAVFVFNYARLPVVRLSASGGEQRSAVDRSPAAMKHLAVHGDAIEIVHLQGYLFFGTADRMVDHVRRRLAAARQPLRYLILDFRHVSGVDSAAVSCFLRIRGLAAPAGVCVYFTHLASDVEGALTRSGIAFGEDALMRLERDVDHALERVEDALLDERPELEARRGLVDHLSAAAGPHPRLADLVAAMSRMTLAPGDVLIRAGDEAGDVFFVAQGRVRVQITMPDGRVLRLRTMTGGAIVGEVALYLRRRRTADVIVEAPSEVFRLGAADLARLEREDAELAVLAHRVLAGNLSEKLSAANRMIQLAQR